MQSHNDYRWLELSPVSSLLDLRKTFPSLMKDAAVYTTAVAAAASRGILHGPPSGTVFASLPSVASGKALALVLMIDGLSVAKNALGAAASCSKKFYVLCMRIANVPYLLRKKAFLLPIAVVPKSTVDNVGLGPVFQSLRPSFEQLAAGVGAHMHVSILCFDVRLSACAWLHICQVIASYISICIHF